MLSLPLLPGRFRNVKPVSHSILLLVCSYMQLSLDQCVLSRTCQIMPAKSFRIEKPVRLHCTHPFCLPRNAWHLLEHEKGIHFSPFHCIFRPFSLEASSTAPYDHQRPPDLIFHTRLSLFHWKGFVLGQLLGIDSHPWLRTAVRATISPSPWSLMASQTCCILSPCLVH